MADKFQEIFESLLSVNAPIKKRKVSSEFAPWLTLALRKSMETRDRLKQIAAKSPEMWSVYTRQRNRVTKEVWCSILDYYEGLIEKLKGDPEKMGKTISRVLDKDIKSIAVSSSERPNHNCPQQIT